MKKRAISITTPEVSTIFFGIGFLLFVFVLRNLINILNWANYNGMPGLSSTVMTSVLILAMMLFMFLIAVVFPNYQIVKYNLFLLIDRISNPDYIGWLGFNRNKRFFPQIVRIGSFGKTEGVMNDKKADVINDGTYTAILPNGNQALVATDMLSNNINMVNAVGWNLIQKHFGVIGFKAWEVAMSQDQLLFEIKDDDVEDRSKDDDVGEVVSDG